MNYNPNASRNHLFPGHPEHLNVNYTEQGGLHPAFNRNQGLPGFNRCGDTIIIPTHQSRLQGAVHQSRTGQYSAPTVSGHLEKQQYGAPSMPMFHGQKAEKFPWSGSHTSRCGEFGFRSNVTHKNDGADRPKPSAPFDFVISGYENAGKVSSVVLRPPALPYEEPIKSDAAVIDTTANPYLDVDEARFALLDFVSDSLCMGSDAAASMSINDITSTKAYRYVLDTYTEGRSTCYVQVPYKGGPIDTAGYGPAPPPWSIQCSPTQFFKTEQHKIPVPHTDAVRPCYTCHSRGYTRCEKCKGRGRPTCRHCSAFGNREDREHRQDGCVFCEGNHRTCNPCQGSGCVRCHTCDGYCSVKQYIQLTVSFTCRQDDHILKRSDLPNKLVRDGQGDTVFAQTARRVGPIQTFAEPELNARSKQLVDGHKSSWPSERILQQRQYLLSVPVHECYFDYKSELGRFWVYGKQKEVYTEDYPQMSCCSGCVIL